MRRTLLLIVVFGLSLGLPALAAAVSLDITGGFVGLGIPYAGYSLFASGFSAGGIGRVAIEERNMLVSGGMIVGGGDLGINLDFADCPSLAQCAQVTLDGASYDPFTTSITGHLLITSQATTFIQGDPSMVSGVAPFTKVSGVAPFTAIGTMIGRDLATDTEVFNLLLHGQGLAQWFGFKGPVSQEPFDFIAVESVGYSFAPVPEPGTIGLVVVGLVGVGGAWFRRRQAGRVLLPSNFRRE
jgi:hypothetical protein